MELVTSNRSLITYRGDGILLFINLSLPDEYTTDSSGSLVLWVLMCDQSVDTSLNLGRLRKDSLTFWVRCALKGEQQSALNKLRYVSLIVYSGNHISPGKAHVDDKRGRKYAVSPLHHAWTWVLCSLDRFIWSPARDASFLFPGKKK